MKLYTEEQVKEVAIKSMHQYGLWTESKNDIRISKIMNKQQELYEKNINSLIPIKLLSNEEIYDEANRVKENIRELSFDEASFQMGAEWVIEQIKQQSNGK